MAEKKQNPELIMINDGIELEAAVETGSYSNFCCTAYSNKEVIIDFGVHMPFMEHPRIQHRIVLHPSTALSLLELLQDDMQKYIQQYGMPACDPKDSSDNPPPQIAISFDSKSEA